MAVVDRLYKWEQRRSAKLSKARREEDLRQARAQRTSCTFRPSVTKPVRSPLPKRAYALYRSGPWPRAPWAAGASPGFKDASAA